MSGFYFYTSECFHSRRIRSILCVSQDLRSLPLPLSSSTGVIRTCPNNPLNPHFKCDLIQYIHVFIRSDYLKTFDVCLLN